MNPQVLLDALRETAKDAALQADAARTDERASAYYAVEYAMNKLANNIEWLMSR